MNGRSSPTGWRLTAAVLVLSALSSVPLNCQALPASTRRINIVYAPGGDLFVLGELGGPDLSPAVVQPNPLGACDSAGISFPFLAKVAPTGDRLVWATYLCASALSMAPGPDGNLYLAGAVRGPGVSIAKLSGDGKSLLAAVSLTTQSEPIVAIPLLQIDASGNVYVAKNASSGDPPATHPRVSFTLPPNSSCQTGVAEQFVAKFDPSLGKLLFSVRIGSVYRSYASGLAVGPDGTSYVVGSGGEGPTSPCSAWFTLTRLGPDGSPVYAVAYHGYTPAGLALGTEGAVYLGLRIGLARALSPPLGAIWKFDSRGVRMTSRDLGSLAYSLRVGADGIVDVIGEAWPRYFTATSGASQACVPSDQYQRYGQAVVARLDADTLQSLYAGFLPGWTAAWFAGPDRVIAARTYYSTSESLSPLAAGVSVGSLSLMPVGPPPAGTITCVTNAASQDPRSVAPGEIISIYGNGIGPAEPLPGRFGADGNFMSELGGVQVSVDGLAAPLLYAGTHQINAVVPFGVSSDRTVRLEIRRQSALIASVQAKVTAQHPGLFMADWYNSFLAALNQDGTVNSSANSAFPGSVVSVFATGLGGMTPPPVDGSRTPQPLYRPVLTPTVWANSQPATVEYIGNAPGLIQGLVQINVRVPAPLNWAVGTVGLGIGPSGGLPPVAFGSVWVR